MIDWLALLLACVKALGSIAQWANNRQLLQAGGAQVIADALKEQANAIAKAALSRQSVADAAARDPASVLRDTDGFRRD